MSAVTEDWQAEVIDLKKQGLESAQIAEAVGKHPATVRKVIARAKEDGVLTESGTAWPEGDRVMDSGEAAETFGDEPAESCSVCGGEYPSPVEMHHSEAECLANRSEVDPLDEFRAEAGEAVGPMQERPGEEPAGALDADDGGGFEIVVMGTSQLGLFDAGGRSPDSASLRLVGGKIGLEHGTAFQKGDTIEFHGTAVVTAVKQQDRRDRKTGQTVGCEQQHSGLILDLSVGG